MSPGRDTGHTIRIDNGISFSLQGFASFKSKCPTTLLAYLGAPSVLNSFVNIPKVEDGFPFQNAAAFAVKVDTCSEPSSVKIPTPWPLPFHSILPALAHPAYPRSSVLHVTLLLGLQTAEQELEQCSRLSFPARL